MSYLHKPHSKPLEHRTPVQLLHQHVATYPNKEAFVFRDQKKTRVSLTFQEYEMKSRFLAAAFLEIGLVRGDRVLVILPTSIEFLLVHMALNRIGANSVISIDYDFPQIKDLTCVIACPDFSTADKDNIVENIQTALRENKQLKAVVIVGPSDGALDHDKVYNYEKLLRMGQTNPDCDNTVQRAEAAVQMDDPALVLFTTGTTSTPKPIQYTNYGFVNTSVKDATLMTSDKDTIYFSDSPFDWGSGMFLSIGLVITMGATLVVFPPKLAFQGGMIQNIITTIVEERCTHALFMSYILNDMRNEIFEEDLSELKVILTLGQPATVSVLQGAFKTMPDVTLVNIYGTTESSGMCNQLITNQVIDTFENGVMNPANGLELKIIDKDGQVVPIGAKGELCVRGACISFSNWDLMLIDKNPGTGLGKNGWQFTNDLVSLDEHGKIRIHGRRTDMIKYANDVVSPFAIEEILLEHPKVKKVCVVGVPDQRVYEKVSACIVPKNGINSNQDAHLEKKLDDWCKKRCRDSSRGIPLSPHYFVIVDSFPLTRNGKLSRRLVRELAVKHLGI